MSTSTASNDKSEIDKNEPTAATVCREFTESTTLHGIKNVFKTGSSRKKRIIWFGCLVVAVVFYTIFTHILVSSFFSFDVITHVTMVNQDAVDFPAVTICNFNPFRKDYTEKNKLSKALSLFPQQSASLSDVFALGNFSETAMDKVFRDSGHIFSDMLYFCTFRRKTCHAQNFTPVFTRLGLCHTFNKGM